MIDLERLAQHFTAPSGAQAAVKKAVKQAEIFNIPELDLFLNNLKTHGVSTHHNRNDIYNNFKLRNHIEVILKPLGLKIQRRIITPRRAVLLDFETSFNFYVLGWCK